MKATEYIQRSRRRSNEKRLADKIILENLEEARLLAEIEAREKPLREAKVLAEARAKAEASGERLARGMKWAKTAGKVGLGLGVAAELLDTKHDLDHNVETARMIGTAEQNQKRRDGRARQLRSAGTPEDPFLGLVQNLYDMRTNHTRM